MNAAIAAIVPVNALNTADSGKTSLTPLFFYSNALNAAFFGWRLLTPLFFRLNIVNAAILPVDRR